MRLDFGVIDGPYTGRQVALMLTFDPRDSDFRRAIEVITGQDLVRGLTLKMADIRAALATHRFLAELGPQRRHGRETGYTNVVRLLERH